MNFLDPLFLFYFLPAVLLLHRFSPAVVGLAATALFCGLLQPWCLIPMALTAAVLFFGGRAIDATRRADQRRRRLQIAIGLVVAIFALFRWGLRLEWDEPFPGAMGALVYSLESIAFLVDIHRRQIPPLTPWKTAMLFGAFPRYLAGPVLRHRHLERAGGADWRGGLARLFPGLALLAAASAPQSVVAYAFGRAGSPEFFAAWIGVLGWWLARATGFAGATLAAQGVGRMLGYRFPGLWSFVDWARDYLPRQWAWLTRRARALPPPARAALAMTMLAVGGALLGARNLAEALRVTRALFSPGLAFNPEGLWSRGELWMLVPPALALVARPPRRIAFGIALLTLAAWQTVNAATHFARFTVHWDRLLPVGLSFPQLVATADGAAERLSRGLRIAAYRAGARPPELVTASVAGTLHVYRRKEAVWQFPGLAPPDYRGLAQRLREGGVTLRIVPVPTKLSVERDRLARLPGVTPFEALRPVAENAAAVYRALIAAAPEETVDLLSVYRNYRVAHPHAALYAPGDARWTSLGMALAASAVAGRAGEVSCGDARPADAEGADWQALGLPETYLARAPELRFREPLCEVAPGPKAPGRVLVLGDAQARHLYETPYGFGTQVGRALGRQVLELAVEDTDAAAPWRALAEQGWEIYPGDTIVWQYGFDTLPDARKELPLPTVRALAGHR